MTSFLANLLGGKRNNRVFSSLAAIVVLFGVITVVSDTLKGYFGSVDIIAYDSEGLIVFRNSLNHDVLVTDISVAKDFAYVNLKTVKIHHKQIFEVVKAHSIKTVKFESSETAGRYLTVDDAWDETLKEALGGDRCLGMIFYNNTHPQLLSLTNNSKSNQTELGMFDVNLEAGYIAKDKEKKINLDGKGVVLSLCE